MGTVLLFCSALGGNNACGPCFQWAADVPDGPRAGRGTRFARLPTRLAGPSSARLLSCLPVTRHVRVWKSDKPKHKARVQPFGLLLWGGMWGLESGFGRDGGAGVVINLLESFWRRHPPPSLPYPWREALPAGEGASVAELHHGAGDQHRGVAYRHRHLVWGSNSFLPSLATSWKGEGKENAPGPGMVVGRDVPSAYNVVLSPWLGTDAAPLTPAEQGGGTGWGSAGVMDWQPQSLFCVLF
ncbi:hypothetical protein KIL84_004517 [Mauremys mutica]|uniref:Uncharacterized protein n=1 Tax=Mauremys mutica TaxID=74926 RepID=A0A9D3XPU1_9SAUR|nr:hypothetical protein KIL84_004517 [Mauremys mutica]